MPTDQDCVKTDRSLHDRSNQNRFLSHDLIRRSVQLRITEPFFSWDVFFSRSSQPLFVCKCFCWCSTFSIMFMWRNLESGSHKRAAASSICGGASLCEADLKLPIWTFINRGHRPAAPLWYQISRNFLLNKLRLILPHPSLLTQTPQPLHWGS